ncbi:transcription antitermination factor NusB [Kaistia dalseonensis]|uniref:Transcription antitermination protein NusB n=1 Tax=Kaistia dalseonensis TaxID=410840 RepID=A0ABU0H1J7_9HYPH|nr:transcription antitermination factor NusB [Kaistia dalseonensis]MCX5493625.1 transcription antitermination factor NusB [Kaistia dalseonensis]MDQ0436186.1 N utilization substance protein B [Kaistia dalseonensis]
MPSDKAPAPREVKPANQRGAARLAAVQALYQMDVGGASLTEVVAEFENFRLGKELDGDQYRDADAAFFRDIIAGVVREQRNLDPAIHVSLVSDWPLTRIDVTLRAILRCGTYELVGRKDVPARVIITEYVDVARAFFGPGDEQRMVNGVLDTAARRLRPDEFTEAAHPGKRA